MPQVDLSSVCTGGSSHDHKVSCETLAVGDGEDPVIQEDPPTTPPIDYAPESFWLSKDAELDWLDRNAFIERKDSGKGSTHSTTNLNSNLNSNSNSITGSQRYAVNIKSKASMIGLPKPQKTNYAEAKNRRSCKPVSIRLFPKKPGSVGGKPVVALSEPTSPKVSCMGRVRSRKDRKGKNRKNHGEPGLTKSMSIKGKKTGFWKNLKIMFRPKGNKMGCKGEMEGVEPVGVSVGSGEKKKKKRGFNPGSSGGSPNPVEPAGLGGVKRFASGRRSDAWAADLEVNGAQSEPLDRNSGPIWRRRDRGPPSVVDVDRDWQSLGPASV